jgi:hypothetical protein
VKKYESSPIHSDRAYVRHPTKATAATSPSHSKSKTREHRSSQFDPCPPRQLVLSEKFFEDVNNLIRHLRSTHAQEMDKLREGGRVLQFEVLKSVVRVLPAWFVDGKTALSPGIAATIVASLNELLKHVTFVNSPGSPARGWLRSAALASFSDNCCGDQLMGIMQLVGLVSTREASRERVIADCPICLNGMIGGEVTACLADHVPHVFHKTCFDAWRRTNNGLDTCPICRSREATRRCFLVDRARNGGSLAHTFADVPHISADENGDLRMSVNDTDLVATQRQVEVARPVRGSERAPLAQNSRPRDRHRPSTALDISVPAIPGIGPVVVLVVLIAFILQSAIGDSHVVRMDFQDRLRLVMGLVIQALTPSFCERVLV